MKIVYADDTDNPINDVISFVQVNDTMEKELRNDVTLEMTSYVQISLGLTGDGNVLIHTLPSCAVAGSRSLIDLIHEADDDPCEYVELVQMLKDGIAWLTLPADQKEAKSTEEAEAL